MARPGAFLEAENAFMHLRFTDLTEKIFTESLIAAVFVNKESDYHSEKWHY